MVNVSIYTDKPPPPSRHNNTQAAVRQAIADLLVQENGNSLLEIGAYTGWQTLAYRDALNPSASATIYDWQDFRFPDVAAQTDFARVDLEYDSFPAPDATFDAVVINQVFEHLKNIFLPLSETARVLKPGGVLLFSVPNLAALHNVALLAFGRQPTTTRLDGSHVRGLAIWDVNRFLTQSGHFETVVLSGYGLHPFTSCRMPSALRSWCHSPVWKLRRCDSSQPDWWARRQDTETSTNF